MHTSEEYRKFYEQCRRASNQMDSPEQRAMMVSMAETWLLLARKAAAQERLRKDSQSGSTSN
jgi:hypothetical protein